MKKQDPHKPIYSFLLLTSYFLLPTPILATDSWDYLENNDVATIKSFETLFTNVIGIAITLIGLTTFAMIITGGIKYLTSGGDPKATETAQATITQGVIGLVLAVASYFILLGISNFTGVGGLLNFTVGLE